MHVSVHMYAVPYVWKQEHNSWEFSFTMWALRIKQKSSDFAAIAFTRRAI